jgi:hypothetical protein
MQNNVVRIVTTAERCADTADARSILKQLHWLSIESQIQLKVAMLTFKVRITASPSYLSQLLSSQPDRGCSLCSSATPSLNVPFCKTEIGKRAFRVAAPTMLNLIPATVLSGSPVAVVKSRLKFFFIQ